MGGGAALKFAADAAQLADEFGRLADGEIGVGDLIHRGLEGGRDVAAAVAAEVAVLIGIALEVVGEIKVLHG